MQIERRIAPVQGSEVLVVRSSERHAESIAFRNPGLIGRHDFRVVKLSCQLAVRLRYQADDVMKVALAAAVHDIGKNKCRKWLDKYEGQRVEPHIRQDFRLRHSREGAAMLPDMVLEGTVLTLEELQTVCLFHNEPYSTLSGHMRPIIGVIQVADYFDARTSGDKYHNYNRVLSKEEAVERLQASARAGRFDPFSVKALEFHLGLVKN